MNKCFLALFVIVLAGISTLVVYETSPRAVAVSGPWAAPGLTVFMLKQWPGETATTDRRGVATFGRGPWLSWREDNRVFAIEVTRGEERLYSGLIEAPRWGSIRVALHEPRKRGSDAKTQEAP